jgi:hypothetical protein
MYDLITVEELFPVPPMAIDVLDCIGTHSNITPANQFARTPERSRERDTMKSHISEGIRLLTQSQAIPAEAIRNHEASCSTGVRIQKIPPVHLSL